MSDIPKLLRSRPIYRGLPIPFTTLVNEAGVPDFRITDLNNWSKAVEHKLCSLCGKKLTAIIYFIGGPLCETNRLFFDPAMHEECARYAFGVCPFLSLSSKEYSERNYIVDAGVTLKVTSLQENKRPEKMGLFKTTRYSVTQMGGEYLLLAGPWLEIEWFEGKETHAIHS